MTRLRFYSPVFTATVVFVYLCISEYISDNDFVLFSGRQWLFVADSMQEDAE